MVTEAKKSWGHFYKEAIGEEYYQEHVRIHQEFLDEVWSSNPKRILEAGCGSGIMSVYFSKLGSECLAIDRDPQVLERAQKNTNDLGGNIRVVEGDIFRLSFEDKSFDVVFSQGVLEHFDDELIRSAVKEQLRVSKRVWISVPSRYYNHKDFGDERLLTDHEWKRILEDIGQVRTRYYFYQRVKRNFLINRPLMLMMEITS